MNFTTTSIGAGSEVGLPSTIKDHTKSVEHKFVTDLILFISSLPHTENNHKMMQIKFLFTLIAVLMLVVLGGKEADAVDCLSRRYRGPCAVWDNETCRRICREERRLSGHCSSRLQCWCEGC